MNKREAKKVLSECTLDFIKTAHERKSDSLKALCHVTKELHKELQKKKPKHYAIKDLIEDLREEFETYSNEIAILAVLEEVRGDVIDNLISSKLFIKVDLPTLGLPMIAM